MLNLCRTAARPAARTFATRSAYTARANPSFAVAGSALALGGGLLGGVAFAAPSEVDWKALAADLEALFEDDRSYNPGQDGFPGNSGGGGDVGPMMVRVRFPHRSLRVGVLHRVALSLRAR